MIVSAVAIYGIWSRHPANGTLGDFVFALVISSIASVVGLYYPWILTQRSSASIPRNEDA